MKELECVKTLISDYLQLVDELLALLKKNVRDRKIDLTDDRQRSGILSDNFGRHISYRMHGIGCFFKIDNKIVIDIDYASKRYDGIDYWFLAAYFKSCRENYSEVMDEKRLRELLQVLTKEGYLVQLDDQYFIASESQQAQSL